MRFAKSAWAAQGDPLRQENVRLPESLRAAIRRLAGGEGVGVAEMYRRVLAAGVESLREREPQDGSTSAA